jgi:hypothetical protein
MIYLIYMISILDIINKVVVILEKLLGHLVPQAHQRKPYVIACLTRFINTDRAPEWDSRLLSKHRLKHAQVRFEKLRGTHFTSNTDDIAKISTKIRVYPVERFLNYVFSTSFLARRFPRFFQNADYCSVVLGKPASGKSILSLQLSHLMARNALFNPNSLIPIYVNLTH